MYNFGLITDLHEKSIDELDRKKKQLKPIRNNAANIMNSILHKDKHENNPTIEPVKALQLEDYMETVSYTHLTLPTKA